MYLDVLADRNLRTGSGIQSGLANKRTVVAGHQPIGLAKRRLGESVTAPSVCGGLAHP